MRNMKLISSFTALTGLTSPTQDRVDSAIPVQTFYVSMPEDLVFKNTFLPIRQGQKYEATSPIVSIISFAVSVDGTVIWYDHWEDGFDTDISDPKNRSFTTEVWGDRNASNGCPPSVVPCTDATDILKAGKSYVVENEVPVDPRNKDIILYDGGDKVQASFNIVMTRGQYPKYPGAFMAGAVEVYDTDQWGKEFEMPIGKKLSLDSFGGINGQKRLGDAFEISTLYLMASEDDTVVTKPDGETVNLRAGESLSLPINMGDLFSSTKKLQAVITTADNGSSVELRWFSLLSTDQWSNSYLSPIGDTASDIRVVMYNKSPDPIFIDVKTPTSSYQTKIHGKSATWTDTINDNEGALLTSTSDFIALTLVDIAQIDGRTNNKLQGIDQDWGFSVVPVDQLTGQVLIGWGYGCSGNKCDDDEQTQEIKDAIKDTFFSRTLVFVSSLEDCTFYIDFDNDGVVDKTIDARALTSHKISDNIDQDMTGAIIWASQPGTGELGPTVRFAAVWGQDPKALGGDAEAMDLGTVVLPFDVVRVVEAVKLVEDLDGNGVISPDDVLEYRIRIQNTGQIDIPQGQLTITGPILSENLKQRQYVKGSCLYDNKEGLTWTCPDDSLGTTGLKNPFLLPKRSGYHDITFRAKVDPYASITSKELPQGGLLTKLNERSFPFRADTILHIGDPPVTDAPTSPLFSDAPTENPNIRVTESPSKAPISNILPVTDSPSTYNDPPTNVKRDGTNTSQTFPASVRIEKTVHHGLQSECSDGQEMVHGYKDHEMTYCFKVINNGRKHIGDIRIVDLEIGYSGRLKVPILAPGESAFAEPFPSTITATTSSNALVRANPVDADGKDIGLDDVTDVDGAGVKLFPPIEVMYCKPDNTMSMAQRFDTNR